MEISDHAHCIIHYIILENISISLEEENREPIRVLSSFTEKSKVYLHMKLCFHMPLKKTTPVIPDFRFGGLYQPVDHNWTQMIHSSLTFSHTMEKFRVMIVLFEPQNSWSLSPCNLITSQALLQLCPLNQPLFLCPPHPKSPHPPFRQETWLTIVVFSLDTTPYPNSLSRPRFHLFFRSFWFCTKPLCWTLRPFELKSPFSAAWCHQPRNEPTKPCLKSKGTWTPIDLLNP